jgi:SAM-dependent methyltransferase
MLTQRSTEKEWIDLGPDYYTELEYQQCMQKLFAVNRFLGFFADTKRILKQFAETISVLDIGCGNGLFVLHLSKHYPNMQFKGTDISEAAIKLANSELQNWKIQKTTKISFEIPSQPQLTLPANSTDVILATLLCHHLTDEQLSLFLQQSLQTCRQAVIINDLHRHRIAYHLYRFLSPILFRNRLITHDGLISIRRGFTRIEWQRVLKHAGISHYKIQWRFPFRWRVILWKKL